MAAKKTRKTQVPTARLAILIGTLVLLVLGALFLTKTSIKILSTQVKMVYYYNSIKDAEANHDYYYQQALLYPRAGYMHTAEEYDETVKELTKERSDFVANATDSTVIWASRDGVEFLTILAGLAEFIVAIALWALSAYGILAITIPIWIRRRNSTRRRTTGTSRRSYRTHTQNNRVITSRTR